MKTTLISDSSRPNAREILDGFFEQFGSCILRGCEVSGSTLQSGLVALAGVEEGRRVFRVVRFAGADPLPCFPVYLVLHDSGHEAELTARPPDRPHIRIDREGGRTFLDALRDEMVHFFAQTDCFPEFAYLCVPLR